ncbi:hypothetical protein BFN03_13840 [Rhodococcus sp. WMMA185]|uniref:DUF6928 family protein n=1 Tax=Rhodococcus sp. WMMA185 TaxID=679318 RepID=UPI0008788003|nr:hypothetical protein [Rhodococcus sp. WMMA185]AOW93367.1 hypothetical protein BFN03_13840 [Rhodococcus sp. WMMA185]
MIVWPKVSTIWYTDVPEPAAVLGTRTQPDPEAAAQLTARLFPTMESTPTGSVPLSEAATLGATGTVHIGCFPGISVVCGIDLAVPRPSTLPETHIRPTGSAKTYYVASKPDISWGSFAMWDEGILTRSFSATPVHIHEDLGVPLVWEKPFWAGDFPMQHPPEVLPDPQSLPFHPQHFAEGANQAWLGFTYAGSSEDTLVDPDSITVLGFVVHHPGVSPETETVGATTNGSSPAHDTRKRAPLRRYFGF